MLGALLTRARQVTLDIIALAVILRVEASLGWKLGCRLLVFYALRYGVDDGVEGAQCGGRRSPVLHF